MTQEKPVWQSPPPDGRSEYDWVTIAATLRSSPNQWLRIFENGPTTTANSIRSGTVRALTPVHRPGRTNGGYQVMTRNNRRDPPRRTCSLFLRYVPELKGERDAPTKGSS